MNIQAFKYVGTSEAAAQFCLLDLEQPGLLTDHKAKEPRSVLVVRQEDLPHLAERYPDQVANLGNQPAEKDDRKELSRLLLRKPKIPLIVGRYSKAGRLVQGIHALLRQAQVANDVNLYVVGTAPSVFSALKAGASSAETAADPLAEFLRDGEVPAALRQWYLGDGEGAQLVRRLIMVAAKSALPVLVLGESGTGKEIVAKAIHEFARLSGPFVAVNGAAIPGDLLESELFGHKRGSFANAYADRKGLWREAQNGTLFVDEIGDLSLNHQARVLRALEDQEVRPVGEDRGIAVNARVITATNRDLEAMVRSSEFREDLYFRLNQIMIRTPSLQDNPEEVGPLAETLWRRLPGREKSRLSPEVKAYLAQQPWPNNVRGLKNALRRFDVMFKAEEPSVARLEFVLHFLDHTRGATPNVATEPHADPFRWECLRHLDRAGEVVRACRIAVRPLLLTGPGTSRRERKAVHDALTRLLADLEVCCHKPHLLVRAYDALNGFKDHLYDFRRVLASETPVGKPEWKEMVDPSYATAQTVISDEFQRLLDR